MITDYDNKWNISRWWRISTWTVWFRLQKREIFSKFVLVMLALCPLYRSNVSRIFIESNLLGSTYSIEGNRGKQVTCYHQAKKNNDESTSKSQLICFYNFCFSSVTVFTPISTFLFVYRNIKPPLWYGLMLCSICITHLIQTRCDFKMRSNKR